MEELKRYRVRVIADYEVEVEAESEAEAMKVAIVGCCVKDELIPEWSVDEIELCNDNEPSNDEVLAQA